jgi:hypothetical protein
MHRAILCVFLIGCGGGAAATGDPKTGGGKGSGTKQDDSIADIASREGIATLGGNQEGTVAPGGAPGTLRMELLEKDSPIKMDGITKEWPSHVPAKVSKGSAPGVQFACGIQYDADKIYVMGEVTDAHFEQGKDHATLTIAFPGAGASTADVDFFPGKPGESVGNVKLHGAAGGGTEIGGSKIIEAPNKDGYTFEASFPWSALPDARNVRVGLRGNCSYKEASGAVLSTSAGLAALPTSPELSLYENLLGPNGFNAPPRVEMFADVAGDAQKERIAVYDKYLTIVGAGYRGGKEYFFRNMGADLVHLDARDLNGDSKDELVVRRKYDAGASQREWVEVWAFKGDEPETVFAHEVSVTSAGKRVANNLRIASKEIEVAYEKPEGWDATSYREATTSDFEPVILPWGAVKSQTYKWDGNKFTKHKEVSQTPVAPPPPVAPPMIVKPVEPPSPTVMKSTNVKEAIFDQYKRDQKVGPDVKPKVDLEVNVDAEGKAERIILIGRDIVVFGPAFKGGATYSFVTLSQFAHESDIHEMNARDLTGDGAADLIVRGIRKVQNGKDEVTLDMMFVYAVHGTTITRVFGIETGRELQGKRVQGLAQLVPAKSGKGFDIVASPGKATGWTEQSYPWSQEQPGSGTIEPLLLPWGKIPSVRYAWSGTAFTKAP